MDQNRILAFFHLLENLKTSKRTGWLKSGIEQAESISDHMYRMSMISLLLPDVVNGQTFDKQRCVLMSIVHDLAESKVGDITPYCGVSKEQKHQMELDAMNEICGAVRTDNPSAAELIKELFMEYEEHKTLESLIVHDIDKFEMVLQAQEYEKRYPDADLVQFFKSTEGVYKTDVVSRWDNQLRQSSRNNNNTPK